MHILFSLFFCLTVSVLFAGSAPKISVVGAGLAGLTAAYRLEKMGHPVTVYEARGRLGGRVHTVSAGNSYTELGGQNFFDGGLAENITALTEELGIETLTCPINPAHAQYVYQGKAYSYFDVFRNFKKLPTESLYLSLKETAANAKNLNEILTIFSEEDDHFRFVAESRMRGYEGNDCKDLSNYYVDSFWKFFESGFEIAGLENLGEEIPWAMQSVKGGNKCLIDALASQLLHPVHTHFVLQKISSTQGGKIQLQFKNGQKMVTDIAILALPCSTLRDVEIEEGLIPEDQRHAIEILQYGTNAKILVPIQLNDLHVPGFSQTGLAATWFNQDHSIMTLYYGGAHGVFDSSNAKGIFEKEIPALKLLYPKMSFSKEGSIVGMSWINEEFSKGSYSSWGVGQYEIFGELKEDDCGETVRKVFRSVNGNIFFAGEHTALEEPATMEGAVESGERAARMVSNALSRGTSEVVSQQDHN